MIDLDDPAALRAADPGGMLDAVLSLPEQCRDGYELGRSARGLPAGAGVSSLTFCGMGGSAIAGDVIAAVLADRLDVPASVVRSPVLPAHCGPSTLVFVSSYSGGTAETLAVFEQALERGCRIVAVTSGGELMARAEEAGVARLAVPGRLSMPRAAFGLLAFAALGAMEAIGLTPRLEDELGDALRASGAVVDACGPDAPLPANPAKALATRIGERVPVIWGADGVAAVAAARWRTQCNENAKVPAFSAALPELDHNEVVGWSDGRGAGFFLVALRHPGEPPDVAARFPLSIRIARDAGAEVEEVRASGGSPLSALLELVLLGDLVSTYLAFARGVDPSPIDAIVRLKDALSGETAPAGAA
ncbi:MAG: SIS domain-containing protein [Actinomycetota bacterium]